MNPDDVPPKKPDPRNLEVMGVAELEAYIAELESEIARARATIDRKRAVRGGADALFRR